MIEITQQFQDTQSKRWDVMLQQTASLLKEYSVVETGLKGKMKYYSQFGTVEMDEKNSRMSKTVLDEAETDIRAMRPRRFSKALGYDEFDGSQLGDLDVPVSQTVDALHYAAARKMDDVLLDGIIKANLVGDDLNLVEVPKGMVIPVDYVKSGSKVAAGMTVAKLKRTLQILTATGAWDKERRRTDQLVVAVTAAQIADLLDEEEIKNGDYNSAKVLESGEVAKFLGMTFVPIERLPVDDEGNRINPIWVKSRVRFGLWCDPTVKTTFRDDMDDALQIRGKMACGACRVDEKSVVLLKSKESSLI